QTHQTDNQPHGGTSQTHQTDNQPHGGTGQAMDQQSADADRWAVASRERGGRVGSADVRGRPRYRATVRQPDLAILVGRPGLDLPLRLVNDRVPHLAVLASEAIGVVGPLVIPSKTACLRCLDYVRAANDPSWPLILAQIGSRRAEPPACDAVLATAVAAQAAA